MNIFRKLSNAICITFSALILFSCDDGSVRDADGNIYQRVKIRDQEWMTKNLNVSRFQNGDPIPEAKTVEQWINYGIEGKPAWCYYENDPVNGKKYGKLYNWYAVTDSRGLAPKGWRIPTEEDWPLLIRRLGGNQVAGILMKSTSGWEAFQGICGNGNNKSHFSALPGGYREINGTFNGKGFNAWWWSETETSQEHASYLTLGYHQHQIYLLSINKNRGLSVRCVRDIK